MKRIAQIILLVFVTCCFGQNKPSYINKSLYFEFYSDYWINMHHFLYQQAKGDQIAHLQKNGNVFLNIGEDSIFRTLSVKERKLLDNSIDFYRNHLIDKSLLFDLKELRIWLQNRDIQEPIIDATFTEKYSKILNDFSTVYKNRFWKVHNEHNIKIITDHLSAIAEMEVDIIGKLEELAGYGWPNNRIRIDLTAYANYAGGYTQNHPNFNTFLSTLDPFAKAPAFIETIFHEAAHMLFVRDSAFRSSIYLISKEMKNELPRNLWHASQFYICGRLVQKKLKKKGINHELNMDVRNILSRYNTKKFRSILDDYIVGDTNMESTVTKLLNSLE